MVRLSGLKIPAQSFHGCVTLGTSLNLFELLCPHLKYGENNAFCGKEMDSRGVRAPPPSPWEDVKEGEIQSRPSRPNHPALLLTGQMSESETVTPVSEGWRQGCSAGTYTHPHMFTCVCAHTQALEHSSQGQGLLRQHPWGEGPPLLLGCCSRDFQVLPGRGPRRSYWELGV